MHVNIAIIERSPAWTMLKEDIYKALVYWIGEAGFTTSLTYNELRLNQPNIIVGNYYLQPDHIRAIIKSGTPFGLVETEIVTSSGHNETTDKERFELHKELYHAARFIMTGIEPNISAFADLGLIAHLIRFGYCPLLETSTPLPDAHQDIDLIFFGNLDYRRSELLKVLQEDFTVKVLSERDVMSHFIRNGWVARSKIALSLRRGRPYNHIGVSRIWHLAHLRAMTLSEPPEEPDPSVEGLCEFRELGEFKEAVYHYLKSPHDRARKGECFYEKLKSIPSVESVKTALAGFSTVGS